jgi:hypothetical protein
MSRLKFQKKLKQRRIKEIPRQYMTEQLSVEQRAVELNKMLEMTAMMNKKDKMKGGVVKLTRMEKGVKHLRQKTA